MITKKIDRISTLEAQQRAIMSASVAGKKR